MAAVTRDSTVSILQQEVSDPVEPTPVNIANAVKQGFLASMSDFSPLSPNVRLENDNEPLCIYRHRAISFSEVVRTKLNQSYWPRWYSLLAFEGKRRYFCTIATCNVDY